MLDVIIIGGGPAGMSAALTLGRAHRTVLLIDSGEGRNAPADAVHNFITHDGTPPQTLRDLGHENLRHYPTVRTATTTADSVRRLADDHFEVRLADGELVESRRLLLATGLRDELPDLQGLEALWGKSAFHCPYCHGFEAGGSRIAVLGAAPDRVRLALHLSSFTDDIALCTGGASLEPVMQSVLEANGIAVHCAPLARLEHEDTRLRRIVFDDGSSIERDAVFIKTTLHQRADFAERLGCDDFPDGCVEVNEFAQTSVAGVYAAGDMARRATVPIPLAAVVAAAASGTVAGSVIDQDLVGVDFKLPNPFASGRA